MNAESTAPQTIPHTWHPKFIKNGESGCPLCGRQLKDGQKRKYIHVAHGGAVIVAAGFAGEVAGDMGWFEVGSACANQLGPHWSKALPPISVDL